jgi:hypothetical protein
MHMGMLPLSKPPELVRRVGGDRAARSAGRGSDVRVHDAYRRAARAGLDETFTFAPEDGDANIRFIASPAIRKDAMNSLTDLKTMLEAKATTGGAA